MQRLIRRLQYLLRHRQLEADLREELDAHRALRQADLEARGFSEGDASGASRRALGNMTRAREEARGVWISPWVESVCQDVRYALRTLRRAPAFGSAIVFVMALGIGATTGVFGLLDALVLKDLRVRQPERLVYFADPAFGYDIFHEVRVRGGHVFETLSGWDLTDAHVEWASELEPATVLSASGDFFSMLGVDAAAGRTFGPDDDRMGGGAQGLVAVITHACWRRRFGGAASAVGATLRIDGKPFTIVGILPAGFAGVTPGLSSEIVAPLVAMKSLNNPDWLRTHASSAVHLLGRLRVGLTVAQGDAALQAFWPSVLEATTGRDEPADRRAMFLSRRTQLLSGRAGYSRVRNQFEEPLWMLLALVGLLMTVACASAANLLIARGAARGREVALRLAIGAGRGRIVRQMLTEAAVWTTIAAAGGVMLASWGSAALIRMMSTTGNRIALDVAPGWRNLAFALALALLTSALAAVLPAFRGTAIDPNAALKSTASSAARLFRTWSLSKTLVVAQIALTIVLLAGAAVFTRSLQRVLGQEDGIDRDRLLVVATDPAAAGYAGDRLAGFYDRLLERLRALPGVEAASVSKYPPITDQDGARTQSVEIDGVPLPRGSAGRVYFNGASEGYFRTLGIRILRGRDFGAQDAASAARVVAINESFAGRFFAEQDPIGRRVSIGLNENRRNLEIVAVVSDAKYQRLEETPLSIAYVPRAQATDILAGNLYAQVRAKGTLGSLPESVRQAVRAVDPRVPFRIETVDDRIRHSLVRERVTTLIAAGLGITALALACAALYGLLAYAVSRQTYEIGLRIALGARRRSVLWLVLRECLVLATLGTAAGLAGAVALSRYVRSSFVFQISPADPIALAASALLVIAVAALAGSIPARRAARIDPAHALRAD